jgi:hypothetical protein
MPDHPRPDLGQLLAALRQFADHYYPGHAGGTFTIALPYQKRPVRLPIPAYVPPLPAGVPVAPGPLDDGLDDTDRDIVQAATEANRRLSADELAEMAGYEMNGRFRERLARLARSGHLKRRNPGYSSPGADDI